MPGPSSGNPSAVVFAYHNVGVRCLLTLLAHGVRVPLVVTHADSPGETIWFDSVATTAAERAIPVIAPDDPGAPDVVRRIAALQPDFIFSFYYRRMLQPALLALPSRGALNMHGSLLPKFRGRAPVNWAVLHGERTTGATLHYMADKPDSGDIVAQTAVPILPDDTAREVFDKVTVAAETTLDAVLPALLAGTASRRAQDLGAGSYFGGRGPDDGIIDWNKDAAAVHNLARAVAPPFPGAFTSVGGHRTRVLRTRIVDATAAPTLAPSLSLQDGTMIAHCGGGGRLAILALEIDGQAVDAAQFAQRFGAAPVALGNAPVR